MSFDYLLIEAVTQMNATSNLFREKVNIRWASSDIAIQKEKKIMLNKTFSILGVFFILMLAATLCSADDQLNAPGVNTTNLVYQGYIVRLDWYSSVGVQLKMTVKSQLPSPSNTTGVFIVNTQTLIIINGRLAGPKELAIGDVVTVNYDQSYIASKVSVRRPGPGNVVKMACKIEEIRFSGPSYVFVMESLPSPGYYYELIVTPNSRLVRNGRPADPSEFQIDDVGTAHYYMDNLKIVSFVAISR